MFAEQHRKIDAGGMGRDADSHAASVKLPASQIDAAPEAVRFLESTQRDGVYRLRHWRGSFWFWDQGAYRERSEQDVRSHLVQFLDRRFSKLTRGAISNVLECVKAQSHLGEHCQPPMWITDEGWPADEVLALTNCLVHLPGFLENRSPEEYQTEATPRFFNTSALRFPFDPDAPASKLWRETLEKWFGEDDGAISTLQEWFGYTLTPDTRQQKVLLIVGPKRSGKGTIARVLRRLVGEENVAGPPLASLGTNFGLWPLLGKTLAIISDARLSTRSDSGAVLERLLSISGEDAITVDRKMLPPVTCKLETRLMILTNEPPRLNDASGALVSRMIVIAMARSFYGQEDETLTDRLLEELPGILLWAIDGWQRLRKRRRFVQPASGKQLSDAMEELASPIMAFVRDCCVVVPGCRVPARALFAAWQQWCSDNGRRESGTTQTFGRDLRTAVPEIRSTRLREGDLRPTVYEGIRLLQGH